MPQTIKLEDGTEQEVFTAEELEDQKNAALEEFKAANPDKTEEMTKLATDLENANKELKEAQEALSKGASKEYNFEQLRKLKEDAENKVKELSTSVDRKIETVKKEVLEGVMKDHYNETLKSLSGEDEDLKKKIEFHFNRLSDKASTKEELSKKLTDAWVLANPVESGGVSPSAFSSAGSGRLNIKATKSFSAEEKALAKKMAQAGGMTLEDKDFE